jgi:hypothetical protein
LTEELEVGWDDEKPWPEPRPDPEQEPAEPWAKGEKPDEPD